MSTAATLVSTNDANMHHYELFRYGVKDMSYTGSDYKETHIRHVPTLPGKNPILEYL